MPQPPLQSSLGVSFFLGVLSVSRLTDRVLGFPTILSSAPALFLSLVACKGCFSSVQTLAVLRFGQGGVVMQPSARPGVYLCLPSPLSFSPAKA